MTRARRPKTDPPRGVAVWPRTVPSPPADLSLDDLIGRLAQHDAVDGVVAIGSTAADSLNPASDYDLIVVLSHMPVPLHVAVTRISGRVTDVIFIASTAIDRILGSEALQDPADALSGKLIRWLQVGRLAFDRGGQLRRAQERTQAGAWLRDASDGEIYATWFHVNYNVEQTRRMLASADPVYQTAVDFRLLYTLADLGTAYFRVRRLPWEGEKAAICYLEAHDPAYLALFRECMAEADRSRKFALYEQLAATTLAPVGGLWEAGVTAIQFDLAPDETLTAKMVRAGLAFWEELVAMA